MLGLVYTGLYIGSEVVSRDGKDKFYMLLSSGATAFRCSVPADVFASCGSHALGDPVSLSGVSASAFNGRVYFSASSADWKEV